MLVECRSARSHADCARLSRGVDTGMAHLGLHLLPVAHPLLLQVRHLPLVARPLAGRDDQREAQQDAHGAQQRRADQPVQERAQAPVSNTRLQSDAGPEVMSILLDRVPGQVLRSATGAIRKWPAQSFARSKQQLRKQVVTRQLRGDLMPGSRRYQRRHRVLHACALVRPALVPVMLQVVAQRQGTPRQCHCTTQA